MLLALASDLLAAWVTATSPTCGDRLFAKPAQFAVDLVFRLDGVRTD